MLKNLTLEIVLIALVVFLAASFGLTGIAGYLMTVEEGTTLMPYMAAASDMMTGGPAAGFVAGLIGMVAAYVGTAAITSRSAA